MGIHARGIGLVLGAALVICQPMGGCSSQPRYLLDTDIPTPSGFEGRSLSGVKRSGNVLVSAQSIYAGTVIDAESQLIAVKNRFTDNGWTVERSSGDQVVATGIFARNDRRCRVRVMKNELDPEMSSISYVVFVEPPAEKTTPGAAGG